MISVAPGARLAGAGACGGELWFVIAGSGRLSISGPEEPGEPGELGAEVGKDTGLWLPPRRRYRLDTALGARLDAVALPAAGPDAPAAAQPPRLAELAGCEAEWTGDRRFRVLLGPGRGCEAATQFVGEIPPGRAPEHSHPYDEVVLVLDGHGVVHAGGTDRPLAPGTRVCLPRGLPHCLENTGQAFLVVLGVFHPGGSPAAKAAPAVTPQT
jgi:quercetin dioxygenase-like cupin family protein